MACWSFLCAFLRTFLIFLRDLLRLVTVGCTRLLRVAESRGDRWEHFDTWYSELPLGANLQLIKLVCCCSSHFHSQTLTQTYTADCDVCRGFLLLELVVSYVWSVGDGVGVYDTIAWFNLVGCLISICNGNTG